MNAKPYLSYVKTVEKRYYPGWQKIKRTKNPKRGIVIIKTMKIISNKFNKIFIIFNET